MTAIEAREGLHMLKIRLGLVKCQQSYGKYTVRGRVKIHLVWHFSVMRSTSIVYSGKQMQYAKNGLP